MTQDTHIPGFLSDAAPFVGPLSQAFIRSGDDDDDYDNDNGKDAVARCGWPGRLAVSLFRMCSSR